LFVIRVPAVQREGLLQHLRLAGIEAGIHYPIALSQLKVTTEQLNILVHCPEAEKASTEVVSLPIYPELTDDMQDYICEKLIAFFQE
jgi:dTDP-4-amino-4,6-dideoxygalactose transaminase